MNIQNVFPSTYLKASDLQGGQRNVIIDSCEQQEIGEEKKLMPVLCFRDDEGSLVLNKTNWNTLLTSFGGQDTDEWTGRVLTLFVAQVSYQGKVVDGIRIKVPQQDEQKAGQPSTDKINLDSEVPF
jgi:hypothetical protein